jgi:hypothetical protein
VFLKGHQEGSRTASLRSNLVCLETKFLKPVKRRLLDKVNAQDKIKEPAEEFENYDGGFFLSVYPRKKNSLCSFFKFSFKDLFVKLFKSTIKVTKVFEVFS